MELDQLTYIFCTQNLGEIKIKNGYIIAEAKNGLKGTNITFSISGSY